MTRLLRSSWTVALVGCLLYLLTTAAMLQPDILGPLPDPHAGHSPDTDPSWRFRNPEFEQWLEELKHEREALAEKAKQLHELQVRLEAERAEIFSTTQAVTRLQQEFDQNVVRFSEQQVENAKRETKLVSGMSPDGAAAMLNQMPEDEALRILATLKADTASQILDSLSRLGPNQARHAAQLTENLRKVLPPSPSGSRPKPSP